MGVGWQEAGGAPVLLLTALGDGGLVTSLGRAPVSPFLARS